MRITLARPRGFCSGVQRAVSLLDQLVRDTNGPVYVYHELVHNTRVVHSFQSRGVRFVESLEEIPAGSMVLFSAHGVSPELRRETSRRQLVAVDATCPLVGRLHAQVRDFAQRGFHTILIGHRGHDEVVGTLGEAPPDRITLVSAVDEIAALEFSSEQPLTCLAQTTFLLKDVETIAAELQKKFPWLIIPPHFGICHATFRRQEAIRRLCTPCELVLVIGSRNSSNSRRLLETALDCGYESHLIDKPDDIDLDWFAKKEDIFLTAGASVSEETIQECITVLVERFGATVDEQ